MAETRAIPPRPERAFPEGRRVPGLGLAPMAAVF